VIAGVIANFKTVAMQIGNLLPRHVIEFVRAERESLRDKKGRAKTESFQNRTHHGMMGSNGIIEGQNHQPIWNRFKRLSGMAQQRQRYDSEEQQAQKAKRSHAQDVATADAVCRVGIPQRGVEELKSYMVKKVTWLNG
jgi:hypothetical protein